MSFKIKCLAVGAFLMTTLSQAHAVPLSYVGSGSFALNTANGCTAINGCSISSSNGTNNVIDLSGNNNSTLTAKTVTSAPNLTLPVNNALIGQLVWVNNATDSATSDHDFNFVYTFKLAFSSPTSTQDSQAFTLNIQQTPNPAGDLIFNLSNSVLAGLGPFTGLSVTDLHFGLAPGSKGAYYTTAGAGHSAGEWTNPDPSSPYKSIVSTLNIYANIALAPGSAVVPGVPEASTWAMMLCGFAGLGMLAVRRRQSQAQTLA